MKPLAAIFLIAVFALSQYAKQFTYLECKLANLAKSLGQQCDCEKQYDVLTKNDKKPINAETHVHIIIDEFYSPPVKRPVCYNYSFVPEKLTIVFLSAVHKGYANTPYKPPQT